MNTRTTKAGQARKRPLVLLADDEPDVLGSVGPFLERSGFEVVTASDGMLALDEVDRQAPDICVLDVLMPGADGREILRRLRRRDDRVPVVLLTQVGEAVERAMALEEGADDYLNKPFDPHELVARIRAVLRRSGTGGEALATAGILTSGELRLDRTARRAWLNRRELTLTPKAFTLLEYLMVHPDEALGRERLLEVLWGFDDAVGTRAVDNRVAELRKALGDDAADPAWVDTVPGAGYRFRAEVKAAQEER